MIQKNQPSPQLYTKMLYKVVCFFYGASILGLIAVSLLTIACMFAPKEMFLASNFSSGYFSFQLNGLISIHYEPQTLDPSTSFRPLFIGIIGASDVLALLLLRIFQLLKQILKATTEGDPFRKENGQHLNVIAAILLGAAFLLPALNEFISNRIIQTLKLEGLKTVYSPDGYLLFTSMLIFVLAGIFKYGSFLQTEFDETL